MPEVTRVVRREYRSSGDRDYESDDDARSSVSHSRHGSSSGAGTYRTVQRYRVTPSRVEEIDRDDDRKSVASPRSSRLDVVPRTTERIEIDRFEGPPRPRSSVDIRPRSTVVERYVERREQEREPEREREVVRERIIERREPERREPERDVERERTRTVVYEDRREEDRREDDRPWDRRNNRPWEDERNFRETDVRIEKRTTERREEPYEVERYQRETEYYDRAEPAPAPIIIRQRAPEPQQIIVQEAPTPPPIIVARARTPERVVEKVEVSVEREREPERRREEPRRAEDEYYYRRDVREVHDGGPTRKDKEWALGTAAVAAPLAVAAYRRRDTREVRPRDSISGDEYSDGESGYVVRRKVIQRSRSRSHSPNHKRHLAEGALAGAGIAAIVGSHRDKVGNGPEHRGRNVAGGAALGAIGAEVLTRARSRYRDRGREEDRDRSRSRSRSRSTSRHSNRKVKTGLALAAAGLAAVAATQYVKNRKAAKQEELGRGRSRARSEYSDYSSDDDRARSRSKHADPAHRRKTVAKAGAATAAVAAVAEHFRSKSRNGRSRSKSRIRTGAEIAGAGLAGAAVAGLYENRKAKEDVRAEEEDEREARRERRRSRSRSRARSTGFEESRVDPELGMVQYGTEPVITRQTAVYDNAAYGAARSPSRSRSGRRHRHRSEERNSRSRSRVRDIAGVAAGTAAAAIGINKYKKRKEKKEAEREKVRREYEASPPPENYYAREYNSDQYTPSPPHVSGGSYFPQNNSFPPPPTGAAYDPNFHYEPNTHLPQDSPNLVHPYNPQDYVNQPHPMMTGGAGPAPVVFPPVVAQNDHVSTNPGSNGFYGLKGNPTGRNLHEYDVPPA